MHVLNKNENIINAGCWVLGTFWESQKLIPNKKNQSMVIARISSRNWRKKKPAAKINSSKNFVLHGSRYGMSHYLAVEYIVGVCSSNYLFVISQILKDITRVSLSRSVVTGRREPRERDCCYFPITPPHLYCLPSATIPFVFPPCLQKIMKRYTPNANMADLSVGLGLVARKRG